MLATGARCAARRDKAGRPATMRCTRERVVERLAVDENGASEVLTFYRIVGTNPPRIYDFMSPMARGRPKKSRSSRAIRLWDGLSVYRTPAEAAAQISRSPLLGAFVAELHIPNDGSERYELDNGPHGHRTLWGEVASLLAAVVSVTDVRRVH